MRRLAESITDRIASAVARLLINRAAKQISGPPEDRWPTLCSIIKHGKGK